MRRMTRSERETFLAEPRVAVLSVAGGGARPPHSTPTFYAYQPGGEITFFTSTEGRTANKVDLIAASGAVTLTVQDPEFPYRYVTVEGRVVATGRPTTDQMRAVVGRYMPPEAADGMATQETTDPDATITLFTVRPERWLTADFSEAHAN